MCSSYEEGDMQPLKGENLNLESRNCVKCKASRAQVVIRVNDPFCQECFLQYCTHKFRSAFGKSKLVRDGETVLVAYSGGPSSTALLHLTQEGRSVRAQKKLRFTPVFIYVDESIVLESSEPEVLEGVESSLKKSGYMYHIVNLSDLYTDDDKTKDADCNEKLKCLFASAKSINAKEALLHNLRCTLLASVAKSCGYTKVITGETSTRLSIRVLSSISQGRGAHIAFDTSIADDRDEQLLFIRPMRDFTSKEIALYNRLNNLDTVTIPTFSTKGSKSTSIDRLTEEFITGLQAEFPSTVTTIMRTSDKLMKVSDKKTTPNTPVTPPSDHEADKKPRCPMCQAPLDTDVCDSSALHSVTYSECLAEKRKCQLQRLPESATAQPSWNTLKDSLCYGCQQIIKDLSDVEALHEMLKRISDQNRMTLRSDIQNSLL